MLVTRQVLIKGLFRGHARFFELNDNKRQAVHKTNQIRPASIKIAGDRHLAHEQKVVSRWIVPIYDLDPLSLLPSALAIGNEDLNAVSYQLPNLLVRRSETHCRS